MNVLKKRKLELEKSMDNLTYVKTSRRLEIEIPGLT